jgi:hypothetical protein
VLCVRLRNADKQAATMATQGQAIPSLLMAITCTPVATAAASSSSSRAEPNTVVAPDVTPTQIIATL